MSEGVDLHAERDRWNGNTYYGRPQLKPAPFNIGLVGCYVFVSGLSGGALLLASLLDLTRGRAVAGAVRRGRLLALLAVPSAACLIADLHTPQRFYNMLRVFKRTSPMSFGTWLLVGFGSAGGVTAAAQFLADRVRGLGWMRWIARVAQIPGAIAGGGLAIYTASLFSATSTPLWAAAPCALAVRFGAASIASAAAAIGLGELRSRTGRDLDSLAIAALAIELAAILAADQQYRRAGVRPTATQGPALKGTSQPADRLDATPPTPGATTITVEQVVGTGLGTLLPLGLHLVSLLLPRRRSRLLTGAASVAILGGGLAMRCSIMAAGNASARSPDISLRFTQPEQTGPV